MPRRIKKARIKFLSLVPKGANRMPVIYKEDGTLEFDTLVKFSDDFMEKGELTAIVYTPEHRDSQGDIASAEVIKDAMYDAAQRGMALDIRHDGKALAKSDAFVAERFIVQEGDPRFKEMKDYEGNSVNVTGAWATVLKINDPELRKAYKDEKWNGVSMAGEAIVENEKSEEGIVKSLLIGLAKFFGKSQPDDEQEIDMKREELEKVMKEQNADLATAIVSGIAKVMGKELPDDKGDKNKKSDDDNKAPVFKGDPSKLDDLKKHETALAKYNAFKDVDMTDLEQVKTAREKLEKELEDNKGKDTDTDEVKGLKKEREELELKLKKAKGRSNQSNEEGKGDKGDKSGEMTGDISKEDAEAAKVGADIAKIANIANGTRAAS